MFFSFFLAGCNKSFYNGLVEYSSFTEEIILHAEKIEVPPTLLYPRGIYLSGNHLVVFNEKTDTLFQIFELPTMKYQGQFGIKGGGPKDFILPLAQSVSYRSDKFVLSDGDKLKQVSFDGNGIQVQATALPFGFSYYNGLQYLGDSSFCCFTDFQDEQPLMLLRPDGEIVKFGDYPEDVSPRFKNVLARNQAYTGFLVAKPDGSRMALFYQFLQRWRIYDADGVLVSDNVWTGHSLPKVADEERCIHPIAVYATEKYVYTLNLDMTVEEIGKQVKKPSIQIFDWDGHPQRKYELDVFISSFVVDENAGEIYGVFVEDMDHIYKFKI